MRARSHLLASPGSGLLRLEHLEKWWALHMDREREDDVEEMERWQIEWDKINKVIS